MTDVLQTTAVRKAERRLVDAIASLNLQTIQFLAEELGQDTKVYAHTWTDCPMTLAQRVGNSLAGKTNYMGRKNVGAFASAWDAYMSAVTESAAKGGVYDATELTNGHGVRTVRRIAQEELDQRKSSRFERVKQSVREATTTECVRETIGQQESQAIYEAITGGPSHPNTAIDI